MKVLIVEDSLYIRTNLKKLFSEMKNINISGEAESSEEAIELLKKEEHDIIILDVELKNSTGFDVLKFVKNEKYSHKPIVLMLTNHSAVYREKAIELKADYFFDKTNDLDNLLHVIKSLV
ncbi:MAG TPA: response regulator [Ignavibacteriaceae bacterium]|nr:response regulator [Ignavibacteriaceae bacterium]